MKENKLRWLEFITPDNFLEEQEKFLASKNENPQFEYKLDKKQIEEYIKKNPHRAALLDAIMNQDLQALTTESQKAFSIVMDSEVLTEARKVIAEPPAPLPNPTKEEIQNEFEEIESVLQAGYTLEFSDTPGFNFKLHYPEKKIIVSANYKLQYIGLSPTLRHELVHVVRKENGKHNGIETSKDYLPTEEGLASYVQSLCCDTIHPKFQHAARYVATDVAINGSFLDVFEFYKSLGLNDEIAFRRSARHKYTIKDTSKPGSYCKSAMYFFHHQKIKQAIAEKPELRFTLFSGKVTLDQAKVIAKYQGKFTKEQLQKAFKI